MTDKSDPVFLNSLPLFPDFVPHEESPGDISGSVSAILHTDIGSGFIVLRIKTINGTDAIVSGKGDPILVGDNVFANGVWEVDAKYGRRFKAKFIKSHIPDSTEGVVRFISSGNVPGVGARTGHKLAKVFGDKLPQVMDKPTTLTAAGITEERAKALSKAWMMRTRHGRLLSLLYAHKLGPAMAGKIVDQYGDNTFRIVTTDPYRLAKEVRGIGFKIADRIALSQDRPKDAPDRISAAIKYQMDQFARDGDCASGRLGLISHTAKLLVLDEYIVEKQVEKLLIDGFLVEESINGRSVIYEKSMRDCEEEVARLIAERLEEVGIPSDIDSNILNVRTKLGLPPLHENQMQAVRVALKNKFCIVTGNPGTGKTSTVSTVMACLEELSPGINIKLAAPTGRAAKRLTESTGFFASTLHRMLEWSPEVRGFVRNEENPLELDVLVVDESSMLDIWLVRDLLRALPSHARVIIVGDVDQLPSVGPGQVLGDMISSDVVPTARLTHIFRQGAGSAIATAAQKINGGIIPNLPKPNKSTDMWGILSDDNEVLIEKISKFVNYLPTMGFNPLKDLQVLAPGHQGDVGTINLNRLLQGIINPAKPSDMVVEHKDREFRVHDRVIQVSNNYDEDVFNGDIGNIIEFQGDPEDGGKIIVDFEGHQVMYEKRDLDQLQHAYCISIHKSQGSEFPVVVVAVTTQHYVMLRRNLIYTGVSRAKKLCCVLGSRRALSIGVRADGTQRLTGLAQRLASDVFKRNLLNNSI